MPPAALVVPPWILGILASWLASAILLVALRSAAARVGWLDRPGSGGLKIHARPIPLVGGTAMALATVTGVAVGAILDDVPPDLRLLRLAPLFLALFALGLADDFRGIEPRLRFAGELVLAAVIANLLVGMALPPAAPAWYRLAGVVTAAIFLTGTLNAVNMQDGMDGLAGLLVLVSALGLAVVTRGEPVGAIYPPLVGAVLAFLLFNLPPASVFMGDSGSYLLGALVGSGAVWVICRHPTAPGLAGATLLVGLPVLDAGAAIVRRLRRGVSPFQGDREHFYDVLLARGWHPHAVLGIAVLAQTLLVGAGMLLVGLSEELPP